MAFVAMVALLLPIRAGALEPNDYGTTGKCQNGMGVYKIGKNVGYINYGDLTFDQNCTLTATIGSGNDCVEPGGEYATIAVTFNRDPNATDLLPDGSLAGQDFTNIQFDLVFPTDANGRGIRPCTDNDDYWLYELDGVRDKRGNVKCSFSSSFDNDERYPCHIVVGANPSKYAISASPCQLVEFYVKADEGMLPGTYEIRYQKLRYTAYSDEKIRNDAGGVLCTVTVAATSGLVESVTLDRTDVDLAVNEQTHLTATVLPQTAHNKTLQWSSSNSNVVSVSNNGTIKGVGDGSAYVIASTTDGSNISAICTVRVRTMPVASLTLSAPSLTLKRKQTATLTATVAPANASNQTLSWSSTDASVAAVDSHGKVTAIGAGQAVISATTTDGTNLTASCTVTVNPIYVSSVTLSPGSLELHRTASAQLTATVLPDDADNRSLIWRSENTAVATVDANGMVTAVGQGTTRIVATAADGSNVQAATDVTVIPMLGDVNGDDDVNVADYITTCNFLLFRNPDPFFTVSADVNLDGSISVADLVGIVNIGLGLRRAPAVGPDDAPLLSVDDVALQPDGTAVLALSLSGFAPITALQANVALPQGVTLVDAALTERASGHSLSVGHNADNITRLLLSSARNAVLNGTDGPVILLTLAADNRFTGSGRIAFDGLRAATPAEEEYELLPAVALVGADISGVADLDDAVRIYAEGGNIVVEVPRATIATITGLAGISRRVTLDAGRNILTADANQICMVTVGNTTAKIRL